MKEFLQFIGGFAVVIAAMIMVNQGYQIEPFFTVWLTIISVLMLLQAHFNKKVQDAMDDAISTLEKIEKDWKDVNFISINGKRYIIPSKKPVAFIDLGKDWCNKTGKDSHLLIIDDGHYTFQKGGFRK